MDCYSLLIWLVKERRMLILLFGKLDRNGWSPQREHFLRAIMEGITFSLHESIELFREVGNQFILLFLLAGAKNETWSQMQADIFNAR